MSGDGSEKLKEREWRNLRSDLLQEMAATIQCRIFVFEITVSEFTELLLCPLSHKLMYTLSTASTFISVNCLLHVLAFVEKLL